MQHQQSPDHPTLRSRVLNTWRDISGGWNQFWFKPTDPSLVGLIRILVGSMLVYTHIVWGLDFESFLGPEGWNGTEVVEEYLAGSWAPSFWWDVPIEWAPAVHWSCVSVLVLFTIGLWSRVMSVLSMVIVVSYSYRAILSNYGLDQINAILMFYLCVGPSGAALSVDRLLKIRRHDGPGKPPPPAKQASAKLALRLIQVHFCVIYFYAGLSKLQGDAWWNGEAVWMAFANYEYQTLDMTWIAWYPWVSDLMTHVTLIWEIFFIALVWTRLRPLVLVIGALLHIGIGGAMGMWTFGLIMIYGHIAFWPHNSVQRMRKWVAREFRSPPLVQAPPTLTMAPNRAAVLGKGGRTVHVAARTIICVDMEGHTRGRFEAYFGEHGFQCVTTESLTETRLLSESLTPEAILVSGRGLTDALVAGLQEMLCTLPSTRVVYVLSAKQAKQLRHLELEPSVRLVYGDTSLGRIRSVLAAPSVASSKQRETVATAPKSNGRGRGEEWKPRPR